MDDPCVILNHWEACTLSGTCWLKVSAVRLGSPCQIAAFFASVFRLCLARNHPLKACHVFKKYSD
jgi:hypothetical protein